MPRRPPWTPHTDPWGTLGARVVEAKGARGARVGVGVSVSHGLELTASQRSAKSALAKGARPRGTRARRGRPPGMCTPPPRSRAILALGLGVCCMGLVNASLGFMMLGERGVDNRAYVRALLKPKPQ